LEAFVQVFVKTFVQWFEPSHYTAYIAAGRRGINKQAKTKPLLELLVNTIQKPYGNKEWARRRRPPRTQFGCALCNIPLCKEGPY